MIGCQRGIVKGHGQLHSNPIAPLLLNDCWTPVLRSPDSMHAEPWGESECSKGKQPIKRSWHKQLQFEGVKIGQEKRVRC